MLILYILSAALSTLLCIQLPSVSRQSLIDRFDSFYGRRSKGLKLYEKVQHLILNNSLTSHHFNNYRYKFYHNLLNKLQSLARIYGTSNKPIYKELLKGLSHDLSANEDFNRLLNEGLLQLVAVCIISSSFILGIKYLLEVELDTASLFIIMTLEIFGFLFYLAVFIWLYIKSFKHLRSSLEGLYIFKSLWQVGLPITEVVKQSKINSAIDKNLAFIGQGIQQILNLALTQGRADKEMLQELVDYYWREHNKKSLQFKKKITLLRFITIVCFFLPSYFITVMQTLTIVSL